ncbi:MAG: hypothetical protein KIS76_07675 [Pyrinomonadaceae bacterium]|nr:hypothetical protein [Pyrinomonadaceae bacterium]
MDEKLSQIKSFYERAFLEIKPRNPLPEINVRFYPYLGINHTIRVRDGKVYVRIGEICRDAPLDVQESLAFILVGKLLRTRISPAVSAIYRDYSKLSELREQALKNKKARGKKVISSPYGEFFDLETIFERLNLLYFGNKLKKPTLSWSRDRTFRILGHHDAEHETIIVSKSLDSPEVPEFVVEYVVFHEMLHILHPVERVNGRRRIHTPAFKRDERQFAYYSEADNWIDRNIAQFRRKARKRRKR